MAHNKQFFMNCSFIRRLQEVTKYCLMIYILSFNYTEGTFGNGFLPIKDKCTLQFSKISVSKENRMVYLKDK